MKAARTEKTRGNLLTRDGVHMNPAGNQMMAIGILKGFGLTSEQIAQAQKAWGARSESSSAKLAASSAQSVESQEHRDARMKWWREAKFGMFIHWGVYSVPAGTYDGKQIGGIGEWIMNRGKIPVARYAEYAKQFNPVKFNADEWVKIAKDAGMKYIVITSKHHDGFAMFHSKASPYNIYDATPFKRDPLAELAAACRKEGHQAGLLLFAGPGLAPSRRCGHRQPLGQGPGRQHGRVYRQDRRAAGPRDPVELRRLSRRALVGYGRQT